VISEIPFKRNQILLLLYSPANRLVGKRHRLLAVLAIINSSITANSNAFDLCSTRESFNKLQLFRSYQGELQTNKLSSIDRAMAQHHLRNSTDLFRKAIGDHPHVFSAIIDSGCTHSTSNSFNHVVPESIRKLSKPLNVGGVGGDILVEYVGKSNWETFNDFGNLLPFNDDVFINEDLPYKLLSPQSFLAHHKNGTKTGRLEDHFQIYRNRSEWHLNGKKIITLGYDQSFLP